MRCALPILLWIVHVRMPISSRIRRRHTCQLFIKGDTFRSLMSAHEPVLVFLISSLSRARVPLRVRLLESTQMTMSVSPHENWCGNCFTNAVVSVSAMR